ncbi:MAG TPA: methionine adenosyltransferase domain-containing protein [Candidatus Saccharimonadales bacterium]|nr:methionine adenosyltransferase domain-containing protein [Candidatus Saccharimonadales bacterium]
MSRFKTAESVSPKHPDKLCDQISDAILDAHLMQDPHSRVAVDVIGGHGKVFITGEVTSKARGIDIKGIVKRIAGDVDVVEHIAPQSIEIAQGVDSGGAGDQGIMVGYATNETAEYLPLEYVLARRLNQYIFTEYPFDGKTQITLENGIITSIVASFQNVSRPTLEKCIRAWASSEPLAHIHATTRIHANPAGDWVCGGFDADAGLTGRKLVVDTYGPRIPIGGGAFSGKDPSKVDRSAAYMARKIAVDYLKKHEASEVYVYLAYAIGHDQPLEATAHVDEEEVSIEGYDLTPNGIIKALNLKRPIYEATARYGHFGLQNTTWG